VACLFGFAQVLHSNPPGSIGQISLENNHFSTYFSVMLNPAFSQFKVLLETTELAPLGPGPRPGVLPRDELLAKLGALFSDAKIAGQRQQLITALILLWHDHLDASHSIAQEIENADGSFLHGIMHRREPDYGNAKYWFRRTGSHPAFPEIARRVKALPSPGLGQLDYDTWDPYAFIDACQKFAGSQNKSATDFLQQVQQFESVVVLEHFLS